ncbi:hypothetical protein CDL15_Pgr011673 [Punica granatum]|uniref:Uncharacterized protein n=1 Tax=Punica granatum TaxID=22663 RepID=A0A218WWN2_PUNGR|nr:hypothetical protein CDL15_Pgr011673 [Punica granatum]PKI74234.1 hypothetical protein CRG98_005355 [Punica granatum]
MARNNPSKTTLNVPTNTDVEGISLSKGGGEELLIESVPPFLQIQRNPYCYKGEFFLAPRKSGVKVYGEFKRTNAD